MLYFYAGSSFPQSILADQNDLFSVFVTDFKKQEFCKLFANTTLFHIYWYYIGNVRTLIDFMTGFSSPESILADQNYLFSVFVTDFKNGNLYIVGQNHFGTKLELNR